MALTKSEIQFLDALFIKLAEESGYRPDILNTDSLGSLLSKADTAASQSDTNTTDISGLGTNAPVYAQALVTGVHMDVDFEGLLSLSPLGGGATQAQANARAEALRTAFLAHMNGVGTPYVASEHLAADTVNAALLSAPITLTSASLLADCIVLVNALHAADIAHGDQSGVHFHPDLDETRDTVTTDPPTTLTDVINDLNDIRQSLINHFDKGPVAATVVKTWDDVSYDLAEAFKRLNAIDGGLIQNVPGDYTTGTAFLVTRPQGVTISGGRFFWQQDADADRTATVKLWDTDGTLLATKALTVHDNGVYTATFDAPVTLAKTFVLYRISVHFSNTRYSYIATATFNSVVNGNINAQELAPGILRVESSYAAGDAYPNNDDTTNVYLCGPTIL